MSKTEGERLHAKYAKEYSAEFAKTPTFIASVGITLILWEATYSLTHTPYT